MRPLCGADAGWQADNVRMQIYFHLFNSNKLN